MSARSPWLPLPLLALLCLGGCGEETEPQTPQRQSKPSGATCPESGGPTEQNFGRAFLERYCLSCHSVDVYDPVRKGAPEEVNFDTLDDVRDWAEDIDTHAAAGPDATNTEMPPRTARPQPTEEERRKLGEWLACGAP